MISYITKLDENTYNDYIKSNSKILIMIKAPWCQSCNSMMPMIEQLSSDMIDDIKIAIIDADENQSFVMDMGVRNLPTFILYKDGIEHNRSIGPKPKSGIISFINS